MQNSNQAEDIEDEFNQYHSNTAKPITQMRFRLSQRPQNNDIPSAIRSPPRFSISQALNDRRRAEGIADPIEESQSQDSMLDDEFNAAMDIWPVDAIDQGSLEINAGNRSLVSNPPTRFSASTPHRGVISGQPITAISPPVFQIKTPKNLVSNSPLSNKRPETSTSPSLVKKSKKTNTVLDMFKYVIDQDISDYRLWKHSLDYAMAGEKQKVSRIATQATRPDIIVELIKEHHDPNYPHIMVIMSKIRQAPQSLPHNRELGSNITSSICKDLKAGYEVPVILSFVMREAEKQEDLVDPIRRALLNKKTNQPPLLKIFQPWYTIPRSNSNQCPEDIGMALLASRFVLS